MKMLKFIKEKMLLCQQFWYYKKTNLPKKLPWKMRTNSQANSSLLSCANQQRKLPNASSADSVAYIDMVALCSGQFENFTLFITENKSHIKILNKKAPR